MKKQIQRTLSSSKNSLLFIKLLAIATVIGLLKDIYVASSYGVQKEIDFTLSVLSLPSFIIMMASMSFNVQIVNWYNKVSKKDSYNQLSELHKYFFKVLFVSIAFMVVTCLSALVLFSNHDYLKAPNNSLTIILWIMITGVLQACVCYYRSFLQARGQAKTVVFLPAINAIIIILTIYILKPTTVLPFLYGIFLSSVFELSTIVFLILKKQKVQSNESVPKLELLDLFKINFSSLLNFVTPIVINSLIVAFLSFGVSAFSYSNKIINLFFFLFLSLFTNLVYPYLARVKSQLPDEVFLSKLKKYVIGNFVFFVLISAGVFAFANHIVKLVYNRGSITPDDIKLITELVMYLSLQIPFYTSNMFIVYCFQLYGRTSMASMVYLSNLIVLVSAFLLSHEKTIVNLMKVISLSQFITFMLAFFMFIVKKRGLQ